MTNYDVTQRPIERGHMSFRSDGSLSVVASDGTGWVVPARYQPDRTWMTIGMYRDAQAYYAAMHRPFVPPKPRGLAALDMGPASNPCKSIGVVRPIAITDAAHLRIVFGAGSRCHVGIDHGAGGDRSTKVFVRPAEGSDRVSPGRYTVTFDEGEVSYVADGSEVPDHVLGRLRMEAESKGLPWP